MCTWRLQGRVAVTGCVCLSDIHFQGGYPPKVTCRYLAKPEEGIDSAFSNYHAVTKLSNDSIQALKQPGCKHLVAALHFDSTYNTTSSTFEEYPLPSMLPQRPPDAPKAKAIEAALPVRPGGEECCAWSGSRFLLDMAFTNPTIPEWQPPPKPEKTLDEILTKRTHENSQGSSAVGAYQSSLQGAASLICCQRSKLHAFR